MSKWRPQWRLVAGIAILAGIWLAMLLWGAGPLDRRIYQMVYAGHRPALLEMARFFTALGEPTVLIGASAICALWLWYAGRGRLGLTLLLIAWLCRNAVTQANGGFE